jgi:dTDP-4-dehydrorhamnose reductase
VKILLSGKVSQLGWELQRSLALLGDTKSSRLDTGKLQHSFNLR